MLQLVLEVVEDELGDGAACIGVMPLDHVFQLGYIAGAYGVQVYHLFITERGELSSHVVYIGDAAAHTRGKVAACITEDDDPASCHVFATVIAHTFDYCFCTGVADGESFARLAPDKGFTGGGAIEGYVTDNAVFFRDESCI